MNGTRTGVHALLGDDIAGAMGSIDGSGAYTAPNGCIFKSGTVCGTAEALISVQPSLSHLKEIIAYCPEGMRKYYPQSPLSNWTADALKIGVETATGKKVDIAMANFGGIRKDIPQGAVLLDDIVSMFPFRNNLTWVQLKGADIRYLFEKMASVNKIQAVSGVKLIVRNGVIESFMVGGKPLDDNQLYGFGTVDFLLDGGDGIKVARNAVDMKISDVKVSDWMVPYVKSLTAAGDVLEGREDDRITIVKEVE